MPPLQPFGESQKGWTGPGYFRQTAEENESESSPPTVIQSKKFCQDNWLNFQHLSVKRSSVPALVSYGFTNRNNLDNPQETP